MKKKKTINRDTEVRMGEIEDFFIQKGLIITKEQNTIDIALQKALLRKRALTIPQLKKSNVFPRVKTYQTFRNWCSSGKWKEGVDWYRDKKGKIMILTSSIKELAGIE
ncbi:hypothetical protein [Aquimarina algiphila]|uniref:Uncharacterized protein n=1 Tax=Aquimarina algiphila TaxID=2047982 RepID=A0A554VFB7_9FLAO|nr:hypothetical protein [Aquimarina algiphila]TSE05831.1 hypothetical protein FOF46_21580 [Aquimarina algiphila]